MNIETLQSVLERNNKVLTTLKHKPIFYDVGTRGKSSVVYHKCELNDDFYFRKSKSITINAAALERCDFVVIDLIHRGVRIASDKEAIKNHDVVKTFYGETKYHYPIERWRVLSGDTAWVSKIVNAHNIASS